jgi:hypothetical protein
MITKRFIIRQISSPTSLGNPETTLEQNVELTGYYPSEAAAIADLEAKLSAIALSYDFTIIPVYTRW